MGRRYKSGRIEEVLVFFYLCLVRKMEKWRDVKLIFLVEKNNERIEN